VITQLENLKDVVSAASEAYDQLKSFPVWWRGQGNAEWHLVPSVLRGSKPEGHERAIAARFVQRAPSRYGRPCPTSEQPGAWLFLMQHYRLPTRLLDWTESVFVATFFAVETHPDKPGVVWALNPFRLNGIYSDGPQLLFPENETKDLMPLLAMAFTKGIAPLERYIALVTSEVDIRMMLQLSGFTIHGTKEPLDQTPRRDEFLLRYEISAAAKPVIKRELRRCGIRRSTLFPDLENLASDLAEAPFD